MRSRQRAMQADHVKHLSEGCVVRRGLHADQRGTKLHDVARLDSGSLPRIKTGLHGCGQPPRIKT
eukprot:1797574-Lingulodinium_polyedra.AAC.1